MTDTSKLTQLIKEELAAAIRRRLANTPIAELDKKSMKSPIPRPKSFGRSAVGKGLSTSTAYQKKGRLNKKTGQRVAVGSKKTDTGWDRYTSAGSVSTKRGRRIGTKGASARDVVGKQLMNIWRRGDACGKQMRQTLVDQLAAKGEPTDRQHQQSKIWAIATDAVANGAKSIKDVYKIYKTWGWIATCGPKPKKAKAAKKPKAPKQKKTKASPPDAGSPTKPTP